MLFFCTCDARIQSRSLWYFLILILLPEICGCPSQTAICCPLYSFNARRREIACINRISDNIAPPVVTVCAVSVYRYAPSCRTMMTCRRSSWEIVLCSLRWTSSFTSPATSSAGNKSPGLHFSRLFIYQ